MGHLQADLVDVSGFERVELLPSVGSTNEYARQILVGDALVRRSYGELSLVSTTDQNAGKGRLDRVWVAPAGAALATSFIVRPHVNPANRVAPDHYHWFTSLAALAACNVFEQLSGLHPTIKWPNDVLLGNRKACGILAQLVIEPEGQISVVVGIGLNLNLAREDLPVPTATSALLESGQPVDLNRALTVLATSFARYYGDFAAAGFDADASASESSLLTRLRQRMSTLGTTLTIHLPGDETFRGTGVELTVEGELVVRSDSGEERSFTVGDVVHVRPQGYGR
ncbi:biotin--[acetyl-CoA-carboxylase] ligase [Rothia sp. SD9660Na]|uniref:biotin--[acetyl-CoA-carboxylase] ligase n=1 Tax=Rothia sp. SD9660Na TaxID=3047030 RepID=UPI0024BB5EF7|nr:biotin--[acetyl-CoA-carboxylase] ligase [Rothia sp. SD9660Na]WHS49976.1 biotin--[acetyl-CoA-carboxylase] ligase [Rothia sp. SD9660Na]